MRELAVKANVSASLVSQLERGITAPSMQTLRRVAEALGVSVFQLLGDGEPQHKVVRADRRRKVVLQEEQLAYELLSPNVKGRLEAWLGRLDPGASSGSEPSTHPSEEFLLILAGRMEFTIDGEVHHLERGDSIQYDGNRPHRIAALGTEQLQFLSVLTPPTL